MKRWMLGFVVVLASTCLAQEAKQLATEQEEQPTGFAWLKQFEGDWSTAFNGTMNCRVVGDRWIINEISFQKGVYSIQTIGYDASKKKFVGSWVDASSAHIWRYSGSLDATGKILVLEAEGPDMKDATKTRRYRDSYEFKSENEIAAVSQMLDDQQQWTTYPDL